MAYELVSGIRMVLAAAHTHEEEEVVGGHACQTVFETLHRRGWVFERVGGWTYAQGLRHLGALVFASLLRREFSHQL